MELAFTVPDLTHIDALYFFPGISVWDIFEPFEVALWRDFADRVFVKAAGNSRAVRIEMADSVAGSVVNNVVFVGATDENNNLTYYSNSPGENCFLDGGSTCKEGNKYK